MWLPLPDHSEVLSTPKRHHATELQTRLIQSTPISNKRTRVALSSTSITSPPRVRHAGDLSGNILNFGNGIILEDPNNMSEPLLTSGLVIRPQSLELSVPSFDPVDLRLCNKLSNKTAETREGHRGIAIAHRCSACKKLVHAVSASGNRENFEHWKKCTALRAAVKIFETVQNNRPPLVRARNNTNTHE